jgi:hypothetical protein
LTVDGTDWSSFDTENEFPQGAFHPYPVRLAFNKLAKGTHDDDQSSDMDSVGTEANELSAEQQDGESEDDAKLPSTSLEYEEIDRYLSSMDSSAIANNMMTGEVVQSRKRKKLKPKSNVPHDGLQFGEQPADEEDDSKEKTSVDFKFHGQVPLMVCGVQSDDSTADVICGSLAEKSVSVDSDVATPKDSRRVKQTVVNGRYHANDIKCLVEWNRL